MKAEPSHNRNSLLFRRYVRLLLILFAIELLVDSALQLLMPQSTETVMQIVDGLAMAICSTPLIWWLVVQPLRKDFTAEKARFEQVIDQVIDSIVVIDCQGRIEALNTAAELTFGYREGEVIGRQPDMLVVEPDGYLQQILARAESGQVPTDCIHHEIIGLRRDGSRFPMSISVSRANLGGRSSLILIIRDISPIREQELRQQRMLSLLEATLEATADAIVAVDWQRRILTYNQRLVELLNVPAEILDARDSFRLAAYLQGLVEEPEAFLARLDELYRQPDTTSFDILRFRDGRIMERSSHPQLLNGQSIGRVWSYRDITDRKLALQALSDSEKRFREIFEQTEDAIVLLTGEDWSVLDINPTAEQLFGYGKDEFVGRPMAIFRNKGDQTSFQASLATLREKELVRMERLQVARRDGTVIHVSVHGKLIQLQGKHAIYCTFRDVTERIRLEEEAHAIQSRLIMTNKMTSLGLLVAGVAHEINNPNNSILANAQLLERVWTDLDKQLQEYAKEHGRFKAGGLEFSQLHEALPEILEGVIGGARRIRDIIANLKNYSRPVGVFPDAPAAVELNRVISLSMALLNHHVSRHTDRFHLQLTEDIPLVNGSPQQLEQVAINLIMNALQSLPAMDRGVWVTTAYDPDQREVSMTVRDEGVGIPAELLERVIEPFFTTRLDSGGTGLGLSIASSIVKAHGGTMTIVSQPVGGTVVTISLPAISLTNDEDKEQY